MGCLYRLSHTVLQNLLPATTSTSASAFKHFSLLDHATAHPQILADRIFQPDLPEHTKNFPLYFTQITADYCQSLREQVGGELRLAIERLMKDRWRRGA